MNEKTKEYIMLEKRQREILKELSLDESIELYFALDERGLLGIK